MNDATASNIATNITASPASNVASPAVAAVTPGWQTSEFWMTALGQLGLILATASGALPARYAAIAGALGQAAYSVSRGMVKSNAVAA